MQKERPKESSPDKLRLLMLFGRKTLPNIFWKHKALMNEKCNLHPIVFYTVVTSAIPQVGVTASINEPVTRDESTKVLPGEFKGIPSGCIAYKIRGLFTSLFPSVQANLRHMCSYN